MKNIVILLLLFCSYGSAQVISNQWFPWNYGNVDGECFKAGNVTNTAGALVLSAQSQVVSCGDSANAPSNSTTTGAFVHWNTFSFTYGIIDFTASFPPTGGHSIDAAVWLLGVSNSAANCQLFFKTTIASSSNCNPAPTGYTEIDLDELLNAQGINALNQQMHIPGSNPGCTATVSDSTISHHYVVDWYAGNIYWYIDGTQTCSYSNANVPSVPMFLLMDAQNQSGMSGMAPVTLTVNHVRVCPHSVGPTNCSSANASIFDDEFTGTGSQAAIYISQTFQGNATGSDCADAYGVMNNLQVSWPNDAGYWTNGIIGPGTTIYTCGTISTTLIANGSGTSGNPITFNNQGAIPTVNINGQNYINLSWLTGSACAGPCGVLLQ